MTSHADERAPTDSSWHHATTPLRPAHTDWLHHHLDVEGTETALGTFAARAAGAGVIPWHLDLDQIEEDAFHILAGAGALSLYGAQVLAGQLRQAVGRRHGLAVNQVGHSRACPFDLHALLPVPPDVLVLGPDHPDAVAWLWRAWGTTEMLRHVTRRSKSTRTRLCFAFWSADWTPWRALETLRTNWPDLRWNVRPRYDRE